MSRIGYGSIMTKNPAESLTKTIIDGLTCPAGRKDVLKFDSEVNGLGIRVTSAGGKIFFFQYRRAGRLRRQVVGRYGAMTLHQARSAAEELLAAVKAGGDPVGEVEARNAAEAALAAARAVDAAFTVEVLLARWAATALADRSAKYRAEAPRSVRVLLGPLKDAPAASIKAADVQHLVDAAIVRTPVQAVMARDYGRAAFNWAMKRHYVAANPFGAVVIERRAKARDRVLSDTELADAWRAAGKVAYPFGPLVRLMILTLQRRGEVAGMTWQELSPNLATWTIPRDRAKNGREHVVHLVEPARTILRSIPRAIDSDLVFTTTGDSVVSGFKSARIVLSREIGLAVAPAANNERRSPVPWVLHDFRRTGVTKLAELGIPPHIADRILNHVNGTIRGVMAIYQKFEFLPERQRALELWAAHVLANAGEQPIASNVAEFPRNR